MSARALLVAHARELALAVTLVAGAGLVVNGVALLSVPAAFILAGVLLAGIGWIFLTEVS